VDGFVVRSNESKIFLLHEIDQKVLFVPSKTVIRQPFRRSQAYSRSSWDDGSARCPVTPPVFKTGDRYLLMTVVGSTPTRFRQF
jgi:hypothetical protein